MRPRCVSRRPHRSSPGAAAPRAGCEG